MRAVIQRVSRASVSVDGVLRGEIGPGLLVFLGVAADDTAEDLEWLVGKIPVLRVFEDEAGKMNRSLRDTGGGVLLISQFTLFGTLQKGTRPSFHRAGPPDLARALYGQFAQRLEQLLERPVPTGVFAADMKIEAHNDGPVTLILDTKNREL